MIKTYDKTSMNKHYRKLGGVLSIQNTQFQKKIWSEETISNPSFSTYKFHDLRHSRPPVHSLGHNSTDKLWAVD